MHEKPGKNVDENELKILIGLWRWVMLWDFMKIFTLIIFYNLVVRIENCRIGWILLLRFIIITFRIQSVFSNEEGIFLAERGKY